MLESDYEWQDVDEYFQSSYIKGYRIGIVISAIEFARMYIDWEKKYQKNCRLGKQPTKKQEIYHEIYLDFIELPENKDVVDFIERYNNLSDRKLSEKIWSESEYWHG